MIGELFGGLLVAFGLYSALPLPQIEWKRSTMRYALGFLPLIGVLVGIILAQVISYVTTTPVAISVPAAVGAVAFSMVIGIVFGVFPSYKAANLNPIDALRHE